MNIAQRWLLILFVVCTLGAAVPMSRFVLAPAQATVEVPLPLPRVVTRKPRVKHAAPVEETQVYKGWTCGDVHRFVQQNGRAAAESIARASGATERELKLAERCLKRRTFL